MKYALNVHLDLTVEELLALQTSLTKKLKNEMFARKVTEQRLSEWSGKGSLPVDNILLCELNAVEIRIKVLAELLEQITIAADAAKVDDQRVARRSQKLKDAERDLAAAR